MVVFEATLVIAALAIASLFFLLPPAQRGGGTHKEVLYDYGGPAYPLSDVPGLSSLHVEALEAAGIQTTARLLYESAAEIARLTGVGEDAAIIWKRAALSLRLRDLGGRVGDLVVAPPAPGDEEHTRPKQIPASRWVPTLRRGATAAEGAVILAVAAQLLRHFEWFAETRLWPLIPVEAIEESAWLPIGLGVLVLLLVAYGTYAGHAWKSRNVLIGQCILVAAAVGMFVLAALGFPNPFWFTTAGVFAAASDRAVDLVMDWKRSFGSSSS